MPTDIKIIHARDFIKATANGQLDLENAKKQLVEIASAATSLADFHIILDTRRAQSRMSVADLWNLAKELDGMRMRFLTSLKQIAVLCPVAEFDQASFFALCAKNRGINIKAFSSFEDAIEWLIANGR